MKLNNTKIKIYAWSFLFLLLFEIIFPTASYALTGGPSQPEVQSFEPVGTTEMVDLFSGDFTYNIPLLDVEGYPINIFYQSGITMDQEASWVGLGWNLNPGVINRNLRGLPDDLNGEEVVKEFNIKEDYTIGGNYNGETEVFGKKANMEKLNEFKETQKNIDTTNKQINKIIESGDTSFSGIIKRLSLNGKLFRLEDLRDSLNEALTGDVFFKLKYGLGVFFNSYKGWGLELSLGIDADAFNKLTGGEFNVTSNSQEGSTYKFGLSKEFGKWGNFQTDISGSSMRGVEGFNLSSNHKFKPKDKLAIRASRNIGFGQYGYLSYAPQFYSPAGFLTFVNTSMNAMFRMSTEGFYIAPGSQFGAYFTNQKLRKSERKFSGYGYMYSQNGDNENSLKDFSRNHQSNYSKETPVLSMVNFSYDIFNVTGEGVGGMFRAHRGDVGVVSNPEAVSYTIGGGLGGELGAGAIAKLGLDLKGNFGRTKTGYWNGRQEEILFSRLAFNNIKKYKEYESFYLKSSGDFAPMQSDFYTSLHSENLMFVPLKSKGLNIYPENKFIAENGSTKEIKGDIYRKVREPRNINISFLDVNQAKAVGLNNSIYSYQQNSFILDSTSRMLKYQNSYPYKIGNNAGRPSEYTVNNPDGKRYIYGIPALNHLQMEASFAAIDINNQNAPVRNYERGLINYSNGDNTKKNNKGFDNYYDKTIYPEYAHSHLLTGILSSDYVDVLGDGITDDDLGTYVKFNWTKKHNDYRWRVPFSKTSNVANMNENFRSDLLDDHGVYIYGEKELWYAHSIETKNYVACFYTSNRLDGFGVLNENGGIDESKALQKLDSILLFSKEELLIKGSNAIPLKRVHFEYDYSLCPNVDNNNGALAAGNINQNKGKLTLKKIWFTYGESNKGKSSPYIFTYNDFNPAYNNTGTDRWGNYKAVPSNADIADLKNPNKPLGPIDNPYVTSNKDSIDKYVQAWHLKSIKLPSGGKIEVELESDEYAYVQDLPAAEMYPIIGVGKTSQLVNDFLLYDGKDKDFLIKEFIYVRLKKPIPKNLSEIEKEKVKSRILGDFEKGIFFKALLDITGKNDYEFVKGYFKLDYSNSGFGSENPISNEFDYLYLRVDNSEVKVNRIKTHPFTSAAFNMLQQKLPLKFSKMAFDYEPTDPKKINLNSLTAGFKSMGHLFGNIFKVFRRKGGGNLLVLNKSFLRLRSEDGKKFGGGSRVKRITINDNWNEISGQGENAVYGQEFDYTRKSDSTEVYNGKIISSGVAANEPALGNEENTLRSPITYKIENLLKGSTEYFIERPIGEAFMPGPSVGYSKVTTRNIKPSENIKRTGTGKTVNEFYTAKDFPFKAYMTNIETKVIRPRLLQTFLNFLNYSNTASSQGFLVETNDMHGRAKSQWVYQEENPIPLSGVEYEYYSESLDGRGAYKLKNAVKSLNPDGTIEEVIVGQDVDLMVDNHLETRDHYSGAADFNMDIPATAPIPFPTLTAWPRFSVIKDKYQYLSLTKHIHKHGLLKKTKVYENGAFIETENLLFDFKTGEVLLRKTSNEFGDSIYNFQYPAHFAYEGMGQAFENIGKEFYDVQIVNGEIIGDLDPNTEFSPGDEILVFTNDKNSFNERLFALIGNFPLGTGLVKKVINLYFLDFLTKNNFDFKKNKIWAVPSQNNPEKLLFLFADGQPADFPIGSSQVVGLKVVRSGKRNMQGMAIGSIVTTKNPINGNQLVFDSILNASAVEYSDHWAVNTTDVQNKIDDESNASGDGTILSTLNDVNPIVETCPDCYQEFIDSLFFWMTNLEIGESYDISQSSLAECFESLKNARTSSGYCYPEFVSMDPILTISENPNFFVNTPLINKAEFFWFGSPVLFALSLVIPSNLKLLTNDPPGCGSVCDSVKYAPLYRKSSTEYCYLKICYGSTQLYGNPSGQANKWITSNALGLSTAGPYDRMFLHANYDRCVTDWVAVGSLFCNYSPNIGSGNGQDTSNPGHRNWSSPGYNGNLWDSCVKNYDTITVNPYVLGIKGNWRPFRSWVYYGKRRQSGPVTNIRTDGTFADFTLFWKKEAGKKYWDTGASVGNWTWATTTTKYDKAGEEIESVDALGIFSTSLIGYAKGLVKAVASNARRRQVAYDGFEDYNYYPILRKEHFNMGDTVKKYNLTDSISHTGLYSLKVGPTDYLINGKGAFFPEKETPPNVPLNSRYYYLMPKEILEHFSPDSGKYVFSAWCYDPSNKRTTNNNFGNIILQFVKKNGQVISYEISPSGLKVEGWQRMYKVLTVPNDLDCYKIIVHNPGKTVFYDDFRFHPYLSGMKSFVYNPFSLRLMAELDDNNYATFYEYDLEGRLVRIKRETERGIMTIQESRTGIKKQ